MNCTHIKVGDRVVLEYLGSAITPRHLRIETVAKVTPTQIVLASNPGVGREGRYYRMNGKPIGGGRYWPWLKGVATPEQIATYDAEKAAKEKEKREAQKRRDAIDANEQQLAGLFTHPYLPTVRYSGDGDNYEVAFTLTASKVRKMASHLFKARTK